MLETGISIENILASDIFLKTFDFDEWPSVHADDTCCIRPYNRSLFNIRMFYKEVFPEEEFKPMDEEEGVGKGQKVFKIKY